MTTSDVLDLLRAAWELLGALQGLVWALLAAALDALRHLGPFGAGALVAAVGGVSALLAWRLQRRLNGLLAADPAATVSLWRLDAARSLPALPFWPFYALFAGLRRLARAGLRLVGRRLPGGRRGATEPTEDAANEPRPFVAATLGPTYLLAAIAVAVVYGLAVAGEPLLGARMGLPSGAPAWQILFLGHRPELHWHLPLERHPYVAVLVAFAFWAILWSLGARLARAVWRHDLGSNLVARREDESLLPLWRRWFAVRGLVAPAEPYRRWAVPMVALAGALLGWAWMAVGSEPYRPPTSAVAVALVVWLSWLLHLVLRGAERLPAEPVVEVGPAIAVAPGWPDVLRDLRARRMVGEPRPFRFPRAVEPLPRSTRDVASDPLLSPLLVDLLGDEGLTVLQHEELARLAALGHVELPAPPEAGVLTLEDEGPGRDREEAERRRNRIVLAPEASGKSRLLFLAAINHVLVHARAVLVVVRREEQAEALVESMRRRLQRSSLRWNVRVRRAGGDLVSDLARKVAPDVVICALHDLVAHVLEEIEHHEPFLRTVGLVIVDDAEDFVGPVEVHARLAFRRLAHVLREVQEVEQLGEEAAPLHLVLAADSMKRTQEWIRSLCGIQAGCRSDDGSVAETRRREAAARAAAGDDGATEPNPEEDDPVARRRAIESARHHRFHRLGDFKTAYGEPLELEELIESCERLAVPWHYRPCGDGRRQAGLAGLALAHEPSHHRPAAEACVVFLAGRWSDVDRELARLRRAGIGFSRYRTADGGAAEPEGEEPIALVTLVDPDEETALTQRDARFELARVIDELPRPVHRPPTGLAVESHLAGDLTQRWTEVGDLTRIYGHEVAQVLRRLAAEDLLSSEERTDVRSDAFAYERRLYVRALSRAVGEGAPLRGRVAQVEHAADRVARLVDRTSMRTLGWADAASVHFAHYPGRILVNEMGRFVRVAAAAELAEAVAPADVLYEPLLGDDLASPRRRILVTAPGAGAEPPEKVHFGRHPIGVRLGPATVGSRHFATVRLDPRSGVVHQRLDLDEAARQHIEAVALQSEALWLYPDPTSPRREAAPRLSWRAARLITAGMRLVLPVLYRGGEDLVAVALVPAAEAAPAPDDTLVEDDAIVLFDLEEHGNGTVRAVHRDGLEVLLRLTRLVLERVLSHRRLLAVHDHWAGGADDVPSEGESSESEYAEQDFALRRAALEWLDLHLRPEGGPAAYATASYGRDREPGEGDVFDLGRCWYSPDGGVRDLLWVKHRWQPRPHADAALDVAFDRETAEESRFFTEDSRVLGAYFALQRQHFEDERMRLADGTVWGEPRPVWSLDADGEPVSSGGPVLGSDEMAGFHSLAAAVAAHTWPALAPLGTKLGEEAGKAGAGGGYELATYVSRFVQGIPYSIPEALHRGLRPPVSTLLYRRGDCDSKSLLLALLLEHCGISAGLFVSFVECHAVAGAALPPEIATSAATVAVHRDAAGKFASAEDATGEAERYVRSKSAPREIYEHLAAWAEAENLPRVPQMWAELPERPDAEAAARIYVPIESTVYSPAGGARVEDPRQWAFLPLVAIWSRLRIDGRPAPVDRAEEEDRG